MKNKKTDFIYRSCIRIYLISLVYAFYLNWGGKYFSMTIVACLTPFIMPLLMKLLKLGGVVSRILYYQYHFCLFCKFVGEMFRGLSSSIF
ncbi:MAG: hypothetical protein V8R63_02015 [Thomasclavelia ramosa]